MLQNPCKTLGFRKKMRGGKPYPASGLEDVFDISVNTDQIGTVFEADSLEK